MNLYINFVFIIKTFKILTTMNKLKDIESMRVITMILVVFAHITRMYTPNAAIPQLVNYSLLSSFTSWIYTFHMPAFVAISGAVYYYVKRERKSYNNLVPFIQNKAKRLLIPYLFFSFFIVIPTLYYCDFINENFWWYTFKNFILVIGPRHLWYLVMLFNLLVLFNIFENKIYKHKLLFLVITILLYPISFIFTIRVFQIPDVLTYLFYFMIGYCFQHYRIKISELLNKTSKIYVLCILILLSIGIFTFNNLYDIKITILKIICSLLGIASLYVMSVMISQQEIITNHRFFKLIDKNNFGLYLFHPMIIYILFFNIKNINITPWLSIPIIFILSTLISILFTQILRSIGLKIVIGE